MTMSKNLRVQEENNNWIFTREMDIKTVFAGKK